MNFIFRLRIHGRRDPVTLNEPTYTYRCTFHSAFNLSQPSSKSCTSKPSIGLHTPVQPKHTQPFRLVWMFFRCRPRLHDSAFGRTRKNFPSVLAYRLPQVCTKRWKRQAKWRLLKTETKVETSKTGTSKMERFPRVNTQKWKWSCVFSRKLRGFNGQNGHAGGYSHGFNNRYSCLPR